MTPLDKLTTLIAERHIEQGALFAILKHNDLQLNALPSPLLSDLITDILIVKGSLQITIDSEEITCTPISNNVLAIKPVSIISNISTSEDFYGYLLILSQAFMDIAEKGVRPIPFREVVKHQHHHSTTLPKKGFNMLRRYFLLVQKNLSATDHPTEQAIFQHAALLCHLKTVQALFTQNEEAQIKKGVTRASLLCDEFLRLLMQHVREEHDVTFYSDRLNITPHYLTKITKKYMKASANQIIDRELITQATTLLRNPDYTLQQIADLLNFSDPSAFGKFFKKHTGKTPGTYRSEVNLPIIPSHPPVHP